MQTQSHEVTFTETEVRKKYVTWDRGEAEREWECLTLLAEHAPGIAPKPLRREVEGGAPVVVMERLPGEPLGGAPLTPVQTCSLGRTLRQMYEVPLDSIRAARISERLYGPTTLPAALTEWLDESHDLSECQDPVLVANTVGAALDWLGSSDSVPEPQLDVLGISDLNPANILWDGETCRLVDFEDGGLTDRAYELTDHTEHLAGRLPGVFDRESLIDAVGLTSLEQDRATGYRPLWAAFWLAMLLPGNGGFHRNPRGTTEMQATHLLQLLG